MELPLPENSPFCGCPKNRKPGDDDEDDIIDYFTCQWGPYGDKDSDDEGEGDSDGVDEDVDFEGSDEDMPPLLGEEVDGV